MFVYIEVFPKDVSVETKVAEYEGGRKTTSYLQTAYLTGMSLFPVAVVLKLKNAIPLPAGRYDTDQDFVKMGQYNQTGFDFKVEWFPLIEKKHG